MDASRLPLERGLPKQGAIGSSVDLEVGPIEVDGTAAGAVTSASAITSSIRPEMDGVPGENSSSRLAAIGARIVQASDASVVDQKAAADLERSDRDASSDGILVEAPATQDAPFRQALGPSAALRSAAEVDAPRRFRTLFISDFHLRGGSWSGPLLDFLKLHDAEVIYLVGDIIDYWRRRPWKPQERLVVQELLAKARAGTRLVYIPGNHDGRMRKFVGRTWEGVEIKRDDMHETADGRRLLVMHGDEWKPPTQRHRRVAIRAYEVALNLNGKLNWLRLRLGMSYWPLSAQLKLGFKKAANFVASYEDWLARYAKERGADGVVSGHIHHAQMRDIPVDGRSIQYINTGDWTESMTAAVEHSDGRIEILRWADSAGRNITSWPMQLRNFGRRLIRLVSKQEPLGRKT